MDELLIDSGGRLNVPGEGLRERLARHAGAWRLLTLGPDLLVALRRSGEALTSELPQLASALPALAGDLAEIPPSDLLTLLHQGRRSGILLAASGDVERCLVLIDGQITWAASNSPVERLVIEQEQASPDELWRKLDEKAIEIVFGLLAVDSGTFAFLRNPPETKLPAIFALDTQSILLDGLRRLDELQLYRTRVPVGSRPRRVHTMRPPMGEEITAESLRLLDLADGTRTVQELGTLSGLGEFLATRACYHFLISGHLIMGPSQTPPESEPGPRSAVG